MLTCRVHATNNRVCTARPVDAHQGSGFRECPHGPQPYGPEPRAFFAARGGVFGFRLLPYPQLSHWGRFQEP